MLRLSSSRLLPVIAGLALSGFVHAESPHDGYLDTNWGLFNSGKSLVPFDFGGDLLDQAAGSAVGADGSLFLAGTVKDAGGTRRMGIAKLKPDGTLDTEGFGNDGRVLTTAASGTLFASSLVRRNNVLYVGGWRQVNASSRDFALCVFSTAGVPLSFLGTGTPCVTAAFDIGVSKDDAAYDLAVQPDGKIVLAGTIAVNSESDTLAAFVRFNTDGTLDTGFADSGRRIVRTTTTFQRHRIRGVAIASNGKIVAVGSTDVVGGTDASALVIRLNADGTDDPLSNTPELAFSVDGSPNRDTELMELALERAPDSADDRIVAVGYAEVAENPTGSNMLIVRVGPNGTLDPTFNDSGYNVLNGQVGWSTELESVALRPGGGYIAAGTWFGVDEPSDLEACYVGADGITHSYFEGTAACRRIDFSLPGEFETGADVVMYGDGIYVSGTGFENETNGDFVAAKFTVDRIFANGLD
jgi:uncharacterized delta-60 repeat protein